MNLLDRETLDDLYRSSFEILERIGVAFDTARARDTFEQHGFRIENGRVFFTEKQVTDCLALMPKEGAPAEGTCAAPTLMPDNRAAPTPAADDRAAPNAAVSDRAVSAPASPAAEHRAATGVRTVHASTPFLNAPMLLDHVQERFRRVELDDFIRALVMLETSELYTDANPGLVDPVDLHCDDNYLAQVALTLRYSSKPLSIGIRAAKNSAKDGDVYTSQRNAIQLVKRFYGRDDEVFEQSVCPMSPLAYDEECLGNLDALLDEGQSVTFCPCTISSLTGPETLAGVVAHDLALCLAGIVYVQTVKPGTAVTLCNFSTIADVRSLMPAYGGPESVRLQLMFREVCRPLDIACSVYGMGCDNLSVDYEGGMEAALTTFLPFALSDLEELWCYPGSMAAFAGASFRKMVLDEDLIRCANRALDTGYAREDDLLGKLENGIGFGSFLPLTDMDSYRRDCFLPYAFSRQSISAGAATNERDIIEKIEQELARRESSYVRPRLEKEQLKLLEPWLPAGY